VNELEIKMDALPEPALKELKGFYEYLVYKYLKGPGPENHIPAGADSETDKNLAAFRRFKRLRDQINPVVDKSVDIDGLINEVNRDIF